MTYIVLYVQVELSPENTVKTGVFLTFQPTTRLVVTVKASRADMCGVVTLQVCNKGATDDIIYVFPIRSV